MHSWESYDTRDEICFAEPRSVEKMTQLRAFVGHSFTQDDEPVVGKFLKYFDQLSKSSLGFSWQHAEPAEPKLLADKVLALLAGKNLFIAICTKKELVVSINVLRKKGVLRRYLGAPEEDFYWKTSDWIIQEIGIAIGQQLDLILLIESGLRQPGGLQGDVEYIPFEREAPEKSFGKILEMITALLPKMVSTQVDAMDITASHLSAAERPKAVDEKDFVMPKPDWKRKDYELALMHFVAKDDSENAKVISEAYCATETAMKEGNKEQWNVYSEYIKIYFGKGGKLSEIERMAKLNPKNSNVHKYLAKAYEFYQQYERAAIEFKNAGEGTEAVLPKLNLLLQAVISYVRSENRPAAEILIEQAKLLECEPQAKENALLRFYVELSEIDKNREMAIACLERIVDLDAEDIESRFSLAYKYHEQGDQKLALSHYEKIPVNERSSIAWNNLGVALDQVGLPALSVRAYRKSETLGETLAMSNLAQKFLGAGFFFEADEICSAALRIKDYHKNILYALSRLKEMPEEEDKKESEILSKVKPRSDFFKEYGRATTMIGPQESKTRWNSPDCPLEVVIQGASFSATGEYDHIEYGWSLNALVLSKYAIPPNMNPTTYRMRVEYRGHLTGRAVACRIARVRDGKREPSTSLLGQSSTSDDRQAYIVLSETGDEMRVMEQDQTADPKFYLLTPSA
jgi:tetratricopeptide (TPR) repeat protein